MRKLEKIEWVIILSVILLEIKVYFLPDTNIFNFIETVNAGFLIGVLFVYSGLYKIKYAYLFLFVLLWAYNLKKLILS